MLSGRRSKGSREGRMQEWALEYPLVDLLWALLSLAVPYLKQRSTSSKEVARGLLVSAYVSLPQRGMQNHLIFLEFTVCAEHCAQQCGTSSIRTPAPRRPAGVGEQQKGSFSCAEPVASFLSTDPAASIFGLQATWSSPPFHCFLPQCFTPLILALSGWELYLEPCIF